MLPQGRISYRTDVSSSNPKPSMTPMNTRGITWMRGTKPGVWVMFTLGVNPVCATVIPVVAFAIGPRRLAPIRSNSRRPKSRPMLCPTAFLMLVVGMTMGPPKLRFQA